jgi:hypothetical protein
MPCGKLPGPIPITDDGKKMSLYHRIDDARSPYHYRQAVSTSIFLSLLISDCKIEVQTRIVGKGSF